MKTKWTRMLGLWLSPRRLLRLRRRQERLRLFLVMRDVCETAKLRTGDPEAFLACWGDFTRLLVVYQDAGGFEVRAVTSRLMGGRPSGGILDRDLVPRRIRCKLRAVGEHGRWDAGE